MAFPIDVNVYISYGKISSYLAASDFAQQRLFRGSAFRDSLPLLLSTVTNLIDWNNARDNTDDTLVDTSTYMFQLCGSYIPKAKQIIANMGQGLIVNPATGAVSILAPFYIEFYVGVTASPIVVNGVNVTLPSVGSTTMVIPLTYIKQSLEIDIDNTPIPRVATDRLAVNVNYTNSNATLTANHPFTLNQLVVIQGDQYQTV